jgi:hypothetical protein
MSLSGIIEFNTSLGSRVIIRSIEVKPKEAALIKMIYVDGFQVVENHHILMEGDDYKAWGNDDDYIAHFVLQKLTGGTAKPLMDDGKPIEFKQTNLATFAPTTTTVDDTRSVHNEADIQRIQTLQQQLDEQAAKLKTITELLFKNGAI